MPVRKRRPARRSNEMATSIGKVSEEALEFLPVWPQICEALPRRRLTLCAIQLIRHELNSVEKSFRKLPKRIQTPSLKLLCEIGDIVELINDLADQN